MVGFVSRARHDFPFVEQALSLLRKSLVTAKVSVTTGPLSTMLGVVVLDIVSE